MLSEKQVEKLYKRLEKNKKARNGEPFNVTQLAQKFDCSRQAIYDTFKGDRCYELEGKLINWLKGK